MTTLNKSLTEFKKRMKSLNDDMKAMGEAELKKTFAALFEQYPDIKAVRWHQYTPYFNDGEECVFSVDNVYLRTANTPEDAGDYEDGFEDGYDLKDRSKELHSVCDDLNKLIGAREMRDIVKNVFGDHVQVTVTPKKIEIEEYEHD